MKNYKPENMDLWAETILKDEFNDVSQNRRFGSGFAGPSVLDEGELVTGARVLKQLVDLGTLRTPVVDVGSGASHLSFVDKRVEPNDSRGGDNRVCGWVEALPFETGTVGSVLCWGTMTFVRSMIEALMEVNRVLYIGGVFIFDVVTLSTLPLCQTVHGRSFAGHLGLHGFLVEGMINFGPDFHQRLGIRCVKVRLWDPRWFRIPQCQGGKIGNFLPERDWYML